MKIEEGGAYFDCTGMPRNPAVHIWDPRTGPPLSMLVSRRLYAPRIFRTAINGRAFCRQGEGTHVRLSKGSQAHSVTRIAATIGAWGW